MSDHSELVAEIASVEKMTTPDRLKHAKKRRNQQMKRWANYERQLEKESSKKRKQSSNQRGHGGRKQRVKFIHNIMLLEAAARNDIDEVRKLLMAGVSPNITNEDGLTALHQCCIDDNEEMLKLLLEFGAKVNAKDSEQWTPLHAAATCGHVHLCKILIDKGAELLAVNADGNMPYDICEDEVALDYIETEMAKRGVTQEEIDEKRIETERQMLEDLKKWVADGRDLDRDFRDPNGATPLHIAAANGYIDVLEFLLDHHVSLHIRDYDSWLPIHAAACWLQTEVLEILVKNGADLDAKTKNGETAFDLAEDPDVKQKILDLKDELESHRASKSMDHIKGHRRSVNPRSASIRRTSMRGEKKPLFKKEAHEEALHFGVISRDDDDDDYQSNHDKENLPATNIDDVTLIIDDETDGHSPKPGKKNRDSSPDRTKDRSPREPETGKRDRDKDRISSDRHPDSKRSPRDNNTRDTAHRSSDISRGDHSDRRTEMHRHHDNESRSVSHVSEKNERNDSHSHRNSDHSAQHNQDSYPANKLREPKHDEYPSRDRREHSLSPPDAHKPVNPVGRAGSFIKNRDSPRRQSREVRTETESNSIPGSDPRNPSGTPGGTLSDLKKQRSENHKFGTGLDAQVQNLFLHSLGTGNKYSSGGGGHDDSDSNDKNEKNENMQNGRNIKNNNNNESGGRSRPPTFLSDSGPLRRFSAPTSHPVIGDDDKFKNNCCVIL